MRLAIILGALAAAARADTSAGDEAGSGKLPLLRLELRAATNPTDAAVVDATTDAVVLRAPGGKTLWRRPPPAALRSFAVMRRDAEAYQRDADAPLESIGDPFYATLVRADAIVVALRGRLVVLARSDGRTLLDQVVGEAGFGMLSFNHAEVAVTCGGRRVTASARASRFLIDCGSLLVYDFGAGVEVLKTAPWSLADATMFPDVIAPTRGKNEYDLEVGGAKIVVKVAD